MAKASVTFWKSDFIAPNKHGVSYTEDCWDKFVSMLLDKFNAGEFSSVYHYIDPERLECTIEVQDTYLV